MSELFYEPKIRAYEGGVKNPDGTYSTSGGRGTRALGIFFNEEFDNIYSNSRRQENVLTNLIESSGILSNGVAILEGGDTSGFNSVNGNLTISGTYAKKVNGDWRIRTYINHTLSFNIRPTPPDVILDSRRADGTLSLIHI